MSKRLPFTPITHKQVSSSTSHPGYISFMVRNSWQQHMSEWLQVVLGPRLHNHDLIWIWFDTRCSAQHQVLLSPQLVRRQVGSIRDDWHSRIIVFILECPVRWQKSCWSSAAFVWLPSSRYWSPFLINQVKVMLSGDGLLSLVQFQVLDPSWGWPGPLTTSY